MKTLETITHKKLDAYKINVLNPVTIQDKINWLIMHDSTPLKGICADTIRVREYVKSVLGHDICVPIVKVYDKPEDIKMEELPDRFVMKANHGFNMNIICKDKSKFNLASHMPELRKWMKSNLGFESGQAQYAYIIPRIVVEEYLEDEKQTKSLFDYKFWCFNGEPKLWTINDGHGHGDIMYYDMNDKPVDLYGVGTNTKYTKPAGFNKMVEYAKRLSKKFPFVRVDFYEVNGKIYLGEMTFTPGNGKFKYKKREYDVRVGNMLKLETSKTYPEGVSICLTGYKVQDYIEETLDSIYRQTWFKKHTNWEVLLGIDGCMDTLKKVREIMHKYKNFRVFMMESNCGTYVTTNTVMSQAKYSGLFRFDCDDIMNPDLVETIMNEKGNADHVLYKMKNFGDNGIGKRDSVSKTCGQMWLRHSVFDTLGGFLPWTCSADAEMEIRTKTFFKQKILNKVLMKRRIHGGNLTVNKKTNMASPLRRENLRYLNDVTKRNRNRQRAVAIRITNSFVEIRDKNTPFTLSKFPFPKMDVAYQNGTLALITTSKDGVKKMPQVAILDGNIYSYEMKVPKPKHIYSVAKKPAARKFRTLDDDNPLFMNYRGV